MGPQPKKLKKGFWPKFWHAIHSYPMFIPHMGCAGSIYDENCFYCVEWFESLEEVRKLRAMRRHKERSRHLFQSSRNFRNN